MALSRDVILSRDCRDIYLLSNVQKTGQINFHFGDNVPAGLMHLKITGPPKQLLTAGFPAERVSQVKTFSGSSFRVENYQRESVISELNGSLVYLGSSGCEDSYAIPVYFELDNPRSMLKTGIFADVSLKTDQQVNALAIPPRSILNGESTPITYVPVEVEGFKKRILKTGMPDRGFLEEDHGQIPARSGLNVSCNLHRSQAESLIFST